MNGGGSTGGEGAPAGGPGGPAGGVPPATGQGLAPAEVGAPAAPLPVPAPSDADLGAAGSDNDGGASSPAPPPLGRLGSACGERGPALSAASAAAPTGLSPSSAADIMSISPDGRVVTYNGSGLSDFDAGAALADAPIPPAVQGRYYAYYWEARVLDAGACGFIAVGLAPRDVCLDRLVGWEPGSWGYHADDGNFFPGCGIGTTYGPTFSTGDTVGCLWEGPSGKLSFTKNGVHLGVAKTGVAAAGVLYPAIGMRTVGEVVETIWGGTAECWGKERGGKGDKEVGEGKGRFMFDLDAYVANLAL